MGVFFKKHRMAFTLPGCCAVLTLLYMAAFSGVSAEGVRDALLRYGDLAPVIYMLLFAVLPAFFFPVAVLAFAGGLLFGLLWGSVYTFIGAVINCALMFFLARRIGREKIRALVQRKLPSVWLKKAGGRKGFLLLIILRLIPAVPYNLINYAFGLTEMPFAAYMLGSAIGIIPGTLVFINIGDKALDVTSPSFWIALGLLVLLLVVTAFMSKKLFPNNDKDTNGEVTEYGKDK
mgnify:CR=1 FL=1